MLNSHVRLNAGAIWGLLNAEGVMPISKIEEKTSYNKNDIHLALDWLSRENKIRFIDKDGELIIELLSIHPETFY